MTASLKQEYFHPDTQPTDEFWKERLARQLALKLLDSADFTRTDYPTHSMVKAQIYALTRRELADHLEAAFRMGFQASVQLYEDMEANAKPKEPSG